MKKILIALLCSIAVTGFAIYEAKSMVTKEYERQDRIFEEAYAGIGLNFDMIKIAVVTGDAEVYQSNLAELKGRINEIDSLYLVDKDEFVDALSGYVDLLNEKVKLVDEIKNMKEAMTKLQEEFNEKYGNKDEMTKEKLKAAKDEIMGLKIDKTKFAEEIIVAMAEMMNAVIGEAAGKVGAVADCIDTCYKNRITEINNELAGVFGSFAENAAKLNLEFEKEFNFDKMTELKKIYNNEEE